MTRRPIAYLLAAALLFSITAGAAFAVKEKEAEYVEGEVLVQYADGSVGAETTADGLQKLYSAEASSLQPNYIYRKLAVTTDDALAAQQWALSNDGSFVPTEEEYEFPASGAPTDRGASSPGHWRRPDGGRHRGGHFGMHAASDSVQTVSATAGIDINIETAWAAYNGGVQDVVVALIDTGVDASHEDLQNILWTNPNEIDGNGIDDDNNGYIDDMHGWNFYDNNARSTVDRDGHGTHGAGTMLANIGNGIGIAGIVPQGRIKLMSLKALGGRDGSGTTLSIVSAIRYAEANGAAICNLSLGSTVNDTALYRAIANSNMLFVIAAGNDSADMDSAPAFPAGYELDNILSVANLNYNGALDASSNYGSVSVDLAAPGTYILSTTPNNGYGYMSGSSMSAPMVTAAAAMVYSADGSLTLADVKDVLLATVHPLEVLAGKTVSGGMLDIGAAITYDKSALSHRQWQALAPGSAPSISVSEDRTQSMPVLTITVTDPDGDATELRYGIGNLSAEYFSEGEGTVVSLDENGSVTLAAEGGNYTLYVADRRGNETVKTVTVAASAQQESGGRRSRQIPRNHDLDIFFRFLMAVFLPR